MDPTAGRRSLRPAPNLRARPRLVPILALSLVLVAIVLAACEDETPEGPPPPAVTVAAGPSSFTIGGTLRPGVNRITFNNAAGEPRNAQLVRLDEGHGPSELLDVLEANQRWPAWASYVGGPGLTEPGRSMAYEAEFEPAQYVMLGMPPGNGGALRVQPGAVQAFRVEGEPTGASLARQTLSVTATRTALEAPARHDAGEVRLRLVNEDEVPHDLSVFALDAEATIEDLVAHLGGRVGSAPGVFTGGLQAIDPGEGGVAVLFLTAGEYALVSLFPEPDGVTPGFQVGLVRGLTVE